MFSNAQGTDKREKVRFKSELCGNLPQKEAPHACLPIFDRPFPGQGRNLGLKNPKHHQTAPKPG
jgi:hypothetical protein